MPKVNLKFLSKFKKQFPFKSDKHFIFIIMAFVMLVLVVVFFVWSLIFLISNFRESLSQPISQTPVSRFDIEGFEKLNLIK